ncbi:malonic semialdehyde reductase [Loktanella sp. S4079]|uniref:malonic semialdehyde reductase n=1 Tax=Loktanella sp. S4079 TaxID=579483 RepID=UPI0005F9C223|nr:malonic semialdehyde reductase [Loktanella sp. S4079]KJZ18524.1 malonic semialdehyde reductase [Loktanella sp. S4079]
MRDTAFSPTDESVARLFTRARSQNGWLDRGVSDETLRALWDILKFGPTSANCSPGRFVFVATDEAREKLRPALSGGNLDKTMAAPVCAIIAWDPAFYDQLPKLFPHVDARPWFTGSEEIAKETAFRNGTLMGGYLMLAARALGLDVGPMSGFDPKLVEETFLAERGWKPNFLCNIGYGDPSKVFDRLPRLDFDEACAIV